jgi:transposase
VDRLDDAVVRVSEIERRLAEWHRRSEVSRSLATIPGVGTAGAGATAATVTGPSLFRSDQEFAACRTIWTLGGSE